MLLVDVSLEVGFALVSLTLVLGRHSQYFCLLLDDFRCLRLADLLPMRELTRRCLDVLL